MLASHAKSLYYKRGKVGFVTLVVLCTTSFCFVVLYKRIRARQKIVRVFKYRLKKIKVLIKNKELVRLLRLSIKLLITVAAQISPYWLVLQYEPFSQFLVNKCFLVWQTSLDCFPFALKESCIWVGYMFYTLTIAPLFQVGSGVVYFFLVFGHQVVWVANLLVKPLLFCASQLLRDKTTSIVHLYRATVRSVALIVYWICLSVEMGAHLVAWCCVAIVAFKTTNQSDTFWTSLRQRYIQPTVLNARKWLLAEDRELRIRRILAVVLPLVLFCLTSSPKSPSASSAGVSNLDAKDATIILLSS